MYNMLVFITRKFIQAIYFKDNKGFSISIDGNLKVALESDPDFSRLVDAIEETFNVDELSQAELNVIIVNCSALNKYVDGLYKVFSCIDAHSVVRAENIIPFVLNASGDFKTIDKITISILDSCYEITQNNEFTKCSSAEYIDDSNKISLELFSVLFNPQNIPVLHSKQNDLSDKYEKRIVELESQLKEKEEKNNELLLENQNTQNYKDKLNSISNEMKEYKEKLEYVELLSKRKIITFNMSDLDFSEKRIDTGLKVAFSFSSRINKYDDDVFNYDAFELFPFYFERKKNNQSIVSAGDEVITGLFLTYQDHYSGDVRFYRVGDKATEPEYIKKIFALNKMQEECGDELKLSGEFEDKVLIRKTVLAPSSGKIYLFNSKFHFLPFIKIRCKNKNGDILMTGDLPVGVIVDKNDTSDPKEIYKWFLNQIGKPAPLWIYDHCSKCQNKCLDEIVTNEKLKYGLPPINSFKCD